MSRTVVDLQDGLVRKGLKLTGLTKKVELVNLALKQLIRQKEIEEVLSLRGTVSWSGDLRQMRGNRFGTRR